MSDCQQNSPCCNDATRSSLPDSLEATISFSGVSLTGCFQSVSATLSRRCPPAFLFQQQAEGVAAPLLADYVSDIVSLGCGFTARFAISGDEFWIVFDSGATTKLPIARAFNLHVGTPVIKFTASSQACVTKVRIRRFGDPPSDTDISQDWYIVASDMVSRNVASECGVFWKEDLPNGWSLATLVPVPVYEGQNAISITSINSSTCSQPPLNTAFALTHNSRYVGGVVKFYQSGGQLNGQSVSFDSDYYGAMIRHTTAEIALGGTAYAPVSPASFIYGAAPYAAIATGLSQTVGTMPASVSGLRLHANILATLEDTQHPKGFPESETTTACSDCATLTVVPSLPYLNEEQIHEARYAVASHTADVSDCPKKTQSMATSFYGDLGTKASGKHLYDKLHSGGVYNSGETVEATILSQTVSILWRLTVPVVPPATFRLTVDGKVTTPIASSATADVVQSALVALSNVGPDDVVCAGGPLPEEILITFSGNLGNPHVTAFSASGATVTLMVTSKQTSHFKSDDPVDTNYEADGLLMSECGSTSMTFDKRTDPLGVYSFGLPDVHLPLTYTDGATLNLSGCAKSYRNSPYESIVADVKNADYYSGVKLDMFFPDEPLLATPVVETFGTVSPTQTIRLQSGSGICSIASGLTGGMSGLTYRAIPPETNSTITGGVYLSASASYTYHSYAITFTAPMFSFFPAPVSSGQHHEFSTQSDATDYFRCIAACNATFQGIPTVSAVRPNGANYQLGVASTSNGCQAVSGVCDPVYRRFTQPSEPCGGYLAACDPADAANGVLPGVIRDLEHVGYRIMGHSLSIDPCEGTIDCTVNYWIIHTKRVPVSSVLTADNYGRVSALDPWVLSGSVSSTDLDYFQYGFIEKRTATFHADVATDFSLRPNIDKTRIVTLSFVSDSVDAAPWVSGYPCPTLNDLPITGRAYFANFQSGISRMPTPTEWAARTVLASKTITESPVGTVWYQIPGGQFGYSKSSAYASTALGKQETTSNSSSLGTFLDPSSIPTVMAIDLSSSSIDVYMSPNLGAHDIVNCADVFIYEFPASFPALWRGVHELLADANEPNWVEEADSAPFVKAMLSPLDWTLTLFEEDCSDPERLEPRRVVARYRLPCSQCKRFDTNGSNYLELVSCDRVIADWPFYLEVKPKP